MSFERVRSHRKSSKLGVRVSLRKIAKNPLLKVVIILGPDVLERTGWTVGLDVEVLRGVGEDLGKMRIMPGRDETYRLRKFSDSKNNDNLTLAIWRWDELPEEKQPIEHCDWDLNEHGALEITLPRWAGRPEPRFTDDPAAARDKRL